MKRSLPYLIIAIVISLILLAPGVWWGDSLNAYIQSVTGIYGTAQPVFMAFFLAVTGYIYPGTLIPFLIFTTLFYTGLAVYFFHLIKNRFLALFFFLIVGFFPPFLANIGVVQTETLQLAVLSAFIAFTLAFYSYNGKHKRSYFAGLVVLLTIFSIVRYDTPQVSLLLAYWLGYSLVKAHNRKVIFITVLLFISFRITGTVLDKIANLDTEQKPEMRNSLMVADIAAISAESKINYVPDYCWQPYLPPSERTVDKIIYGQEHWRDAFYSYIYNIDPSVGIFYYNTRTHTADLFSTWLKVISKHPLLFFKYHLRVFGYLVFNDYFNMGIWSGLRDTHVSHAALKIEKTEPVVAFLQKHNDRFYYRDGSLYLTHDNTPMTTGEEEALLKLVESRRAADVQWMRWYSSVPVKTYNTANPIAEKYVNPFFEIFKRFLRPFCFIFSYLLLLVAMLPFYRYIKPGYYRFTFFILSSCGIFHILLRLVILTDPVYRFGMITILFSIFSFTLLFAGKTQSLPE